MNSEMIATISLVLFVVTVIIGVKMKFNLGLLGLAVAFILGFFVQVEGGSMSAAALGGKPFTALFPMKIFWPVLGVSLMLGVGNTNGTYDIAIHWLTRLAGGRRALLPPLLFVAMTIVVTLGIGSAGATMLFCTIAVNIAYDQDIDPVFMLMCLLCGCFSGVGSPFSMLGIINNNYAMEYYGERIAPGYLYPRTLIMSCICFAVLYISFKGWKLERWPKQKLDEMEKMNRKQILTLIGFFAFMFLSLVCGLDLGLCGILIAAVLVLLGCADQKKIIAEVPWNSIVMIAGMCIFAGVVKEAGGMDLLTNILLKVMNHTTVKPIYALIGGLLGLVSSITSVVMPSMMPTIPGVATATGVNPYALMLALSFCANTCSCSPVNSMGAMAYGIMGGKKKWDQDAVFKKQFVWSFIMLAVVVVLATVGICG